MPRFTVYGLSASWHGSGVLPNLVKLATILLLCWSMLAAAEPVRRAVELYSRSDYQGSLRLLVNSSSPSAATYALIGKNYMGLQNYGSAAQAFKKAVSLDPKSSDYYLGLGLAYERMAQHAKFIAAPRHSMQARQCFEEAVALDPHNREAMNNLFDYYLAAPTMLGGGLDKAEALANRIATERPSDYHFEEAQIADKHKDFKSAEAHLRKAMDLAPSDVGRVLDLASYLSRHGRYDESDSVFRRAERLSPDNHRLIFERARYYLDSGRDAARARQLLEQYMKCTITPEDPTKETAAKLLRRATGA